MYSKEQHTSSLLRVPGPRDLRYFFPLSFSGLPITPNLGGTAGLALQATDCPAVFDFPQDTMVASIVPRGPVGFVQHIVLGMHVPVKGGSWV